MKPLDEIKKCPFIHIENDTCGLLKAIGCKIALDGTYTDPVTRKTWKFVFSDDPTFEHLSVSSHNKTPDWDTMCKLKEIFFQDEEECVEFHPKKSEYLNLHEHCLHIWRYKGELPEGWYCR